MGTLRLVLATLVLLSHAGVRFGNYNPGVMAVVVFYLISGYVMAGLIRAHYASRERAGAFYADRALRIFPQYLTYMLAALVWQVSTRTHTTFLARDPTLLDLVNNVTVVPLNFFMFNGSDAYTLVPPAWSLGAELQFYVLAPLALLRPRIGAVLAAASLAVHACAALTLIDSDWFGYRLLAGVLWVFTLGMGLHHLRRRGLRWVWAIAAAAPLLALAGWLFLRARHIDLWPFNTEVLIGWGVGVPLVVALSRVRSARWDHWAGDVSYGVFLNHFLLIWLLLPAQGPYSAPQLLLLVAASVACSWATQRWIERPVLALRRHLRNTPRETTQSVTRVT